MTYLVLRARPEITLGLNENSPGWIPPVPPQPAPPQPGSYFEPPSGIDPLTNLPYPTVIPQPAPQPVVIPAPILGPITISRDEIPPPSFQPLENRFPQPLPTPLDPYAGDPGVSVAPTLPTTLDPNGFQPIVTLAPPVDPSIYPIGTGENGPNSFPYPPGSTSAPGYIPQPMPPEPNWPDLNTTTNPPMIVPAIPPSTVPAESLENSKPVFAGGAWAWALAAGAMLLLFNRPATVYRRARRKAA